jgi:CubicO group peptidase (beta-lactamase class C family)
MEDANTLEFDGQRYLDGRASDPRKLGWMSGFPPPADKLVTFDSDRFLDFPQIRWSLAHMRELAATTAVRRGDAPRVSLGAPSAADAAAIDALAFTDMNGRARRFGETLDDTYTDGLIVLHRGRVVYERYLGALQPQLPHACFSITKSYAATLTAALVHERVLDDAKTVPHYLPEMRGTAFDDATLRQVMDMQTGLAYSEVYADERSSIWEYARASGLRPRPAGYEGAATACDYLRTLRKEGEHAQAFAYKTVNTEVMCWLMARVTGRSLAQLLHERLWAPLGCEEDAYIVVDPAGMPMGGGGMSASLRDLARFGELMRREGDWNGRQLIPSSVVHETRRGDDPAKFAKAGYTLLPGYSYRNMWWVSHNELDAFEGRGIHGQRLYVAPKADMVVARFASHPVASSAANDPITLPQMLALGRMLRAA